MVKIVSLDFGVSVPSFRLVDPFRIVPGYCKSGFENAALLLQTPDFAVTISFSNALQEDNRSAAVKSESEIFHRFLSKMLGS